jgi:SAM-dependent methyltransferase
MTTQDPPNRDQAALWNDTSGQSWVELQGVLDRMLAPFAIRLVDEAFPGAGARALDIGCGAGATTLAMARRLGPAGLALGADISRPLVEAATVAAADAGLPHARFVLADAQVHAFERHYFDALLSRFGVMFFDDPPAAFANLHRALRPGAPLAFVCWRTPAENPFMTAGPRAIASLLPPAPPPDPLAPGPFALADADRTRGLLAGAGWTDVTFERFDVPTEISPDDLARYAPRIGGVALALRNADEPTRARILEAVQAGYEPFTQGGVVRFAAAAWLVRARA